MAPVNKNPALTIEEARILFTYDPVAGTLRCNVTEGRRFKGTLYDPAGTVHVDDFNYAVTRLCWFLYYGVWPIDLVDHRDRDNRNNTIDNLREATHSQNQHNKIQIGATGYPGVTWRNRATNPYLTKIRINGKRINLGSFPTAEAAAEAYKQAKQKYHGEFTPEELR